jgi:hypothetical protein
VANITNKYGLPAALVRAVQNDPYQGGGDISATKLIDSPRIRQLTAQYRHAIEEDVTERVWALMGQAMHHVLERAGIDEDDHVLVEERLFAGMEGWTVSGQFDRLNLTTQTLQDWKLTTVFKAKGSDDWTRQLNVLRWLANENGMRVERLEIIAFFRDFRPSEAERNPDYPPINVQVIEVPVWPLDETEAYIRERVRLHQVANAHVGSDLPRCTDEERWYSGESWALMKPGGKRAVKVLDAKPEIVPDGLILEHRPGRYKRCEKFCKVAPWCAQWQSTLTTAGHETPES